MIETEVNQHSVFLYIIKGVSSIAYHTELCLYRETSQ